MSGEDKRVVRTREALSQAFLDLVAERDYEAITVADVIARADVGRSTFYQHYSSRDDLLAAVMEGGFAALADTVGDGPHVVHLEDWLGIFWENRRAGRVLLSGQTRASILRELCGRLEKRLERAARQARDPPAPQKLVAAMLAEAQLGLLHAWLAGRAAASPAAMAKTLRLAAQGLVHGLYDGRAP